MRYCCKSRLFPTLALLLPLALLLTACGSAAAPEEIAVTTKFAAGEMTPNTIQAKQGDTVTLQIESDTPGAFHLHGYDLPGDATADAPARIQFVANATGRFALTFHGSPSEAEPNSAADKSGGSNYDGPVESAAPLSIDIATQVDDGGGLHVRVATEGWDWAPDEVNEEYLEGAGHAHIYVDGKKVGRIYGPYHYLPSLEPGPREVRVDLTTNDHNVLTWQGQPLEATETVIVPETTAMGQHQTGPEPEPSVSDTPMSLEVMAHEDALGGYNLQVIPQGFKFSPTVGQSHQPGKGYAQLLIDGEAVTRLYVPWLKLPAQGEGMHTFTVALLNNEGQPYHYDGQPVAASAQVHEAPKTAGSGSGTSADHHGGSGGGSDHHGGGNTGSAATGSTELEIGYLEVLPR